ncbi:polycystic kidney disease 1 like 1-like isoform X2 [Myxocyprinus asiaticus]|uniref:polycystic kidney disease 1 like 1-like isoform X2 n=1 Tax=Myxocyprinus asiaticus TaxID=70543 RepID=UPI002222F95D|nr:polycystic kidney disease 1 like 1-like isoform X2 [Myxocyprinus asiaticus]
MPDVNNRSHDISKWNQFDLRPCSSAENQQVCGGRINNLQSWCYVGWTLCLSISLACIILTGTLGIKFSKTKSLMWVHSVFFSFVCFGFVVHPAMILIIAIAVSSLHQKIADWFQSLSVREPVTELLRHGCQKMDTVLFSPYQHPQGRITHLEKVIGTVTMFAKQTKRTKK